MLELIDEALEALLRATVPLSATDVDVSFEPPSKEWSAKLTRPTVNLFLCDVKRAVEGSRGGMRTVTVDGQLVHRMAFPVIELRYVVTAWTTDLGDERGLLAGVMRSVLAHDQLVREYLPPGLDSIEPPRLLLARSNDDGVDVFKALEGQLKAGLNLFVTAEVDTGAGRPAGPPVTEIGTSIGRMSGPREHRRRVAGEVVDAAARGAVGAVVRSPVDAAVVNGAGQFLVRAAPGDELVLETDPQLVAVVGTEGGVRFG